MRISSSKVTWTRRNRCARKARSATTPAITRLPEPYPVFHITAITHRKDAVYPATIVGMPPMEDFYIGGASVKLFLPIFKMNFPEIVDIALPAEGVFHNLVFVSIKKTYPMQAYKIMHGLWGMGQMMFTKYIVVVDADVDVHNTSDVLFHLSANTDPQRDSIFTKGPADVLDHATTEMAIGSKLGIDATKKLPGEGHKRAWPPLIKMDEATRKKINFLFGNAGDKLSKNGLNCHCLHETTRSIQQRRAKPDAGRGDCQCASKKLSRRIPVPIPIMSATP